MTRIPLHRNFYPTFLVLFFQSYFNRFPTRIPCLGLQFALLHMYFPLVFRFWFVFLHREIDPTFPDKFFPFESFSAFYTRIQCVWIFTISHLFCTGFLTRIPCKGIFKLTFLDVLDYSSILTRIPCVGIFNLSFLDFDFILNFRLVFLA